LLTDDQQRRLGELETATGGNGRGFVEALLRNGSLTRQERAQAIAIRDRMRRAPKDPGTVVDPPGRPAGGAVPDRVTERLLRNGIRRGA
jgi:hypothetical protein